jgi:hypothetical protein
MMMMTTTVQLLLSWLLTMSLSAVSVYSLTATTAATATTANNNINNIDTFLPTRIRYQDLTSTTSNKNKNDNESLLFSALVDVGMISITEMPPSFPEARDQMHKYWHDCRQVSSLTKSHTFPDGTIRSTMATHTTTNAGSAGNAAGSALQEMNHGGDNHDAHDAAPDACQEFNAASTVFRRHVDQVVRLFAQRWTEQCEITMTTLQHEDHQDDDDDYYPYEPLLRNAQQQADSGGHNDAGAGAAADYDTFLDVVNQGEHLEHFHEYQSSSTATTTTTTTTTIEWHTDQGLFLAFTPGVMMMMTTNNTIADHHYDNVVEMADGFYIELPDGSRPMVQFDSNDHLVLLLGDGMNQVYNTNNNKKKKTTCDFRVVPHALSMPSQSSSSSSNMMDPQQRRLWYGRMVLPPANAVHPQHNNNITFGTIRQNLIRHNNNHVVVDMALGCSSSSGGSGSGHGSRGGPYGFARQLEEAACEEGTLLCKSYSSGKRRIIFWAATSAV